MCVERCTVVSSKLINAEYSAEEPSVMKEPAINDEA